MQAQTINGHLKELRVAGGKVYINGHVDYLRVAGGVVYNYGRVDDIHQSSGVQYGILQQLQVRVVYRDREKIVYRDNNETAHVRDLLDAAMEVNRRQAERIKELERIISEHRENESPDPWEVQPTQADCEQLLNQFDIFTNQ